MIVVFLNFWIYQNVPANCCLAKMVKSRLIDHFKQNWYNSVFEISKCLNYRIFKQNHEFEKYLTELPRVRIAYSKFRHVNHKLPIEKGRFFGIVREDRICNLCNSAKLGDEYHYIFECTFFKMGGKNLFLFSIIKNITHKNSMIFLIFRIIIICFALLNFVKSF